MTHRDDHTVGAFVPPLPQGWNGELLECEVTRRIVPTAPLGRLFEIQAGRSPELPAVLSGSGSLSYAELNESANRLARLLVAEGVGPEDVVGIHLPRSADFLVALLAVVKAGGAYLPLDPDYPADRLRYMVEDARPACVLTTDGAHLPVQTRKLGYYTAVAAARTRAAADVTDGERPRPLRITNLAYVIYTSGSSGRPKAVAVSHCGLGNLGATHAVRPGSRVLQFASFSFDASMADICMTLLSGGCLVLAEGRAERFGAGLSQLALQHGVTHVTMPPSVLASLPGPDALPADTTVIVAGEPCPAELAEQWSAGRRMLNVYGPTEATVAVTMSDPMSSTGVPAVGRPLAHTRLHVLDRDLGHCPVGEVGEVYLAGVGLARGYLNRPGLTAERFVADPYGPPGLRMYRTGDLGRRRADGTYDVIGRADDQVKIRGFRIELGEIQSTLNRLPAVAQSAVIVRDLPDGGGGALVAYVVGAEGLADGPPQHDDLRGRVAAQLPEHMVPSLFVTVDALPLTPNGKLDREALPDPFPAADSGRAARTPHEKTLCSAFAAVLGLPSVAADANFFHLGGQSLLAARVVARVKDAGLLITMQDLFRNPTAQALAELATEALAAPEPPQPQPARPLISLSAEDLEFLADRR